MFRIEAFCEDKNLPRVYRALTGLVIGQPKVQPVANAKAEGGVVKQKVNGNLPEIFAAYVKQHKLELVTPSQLKAFAIENGYAEGSYSLFLNRLLKDKILRKKPGTKGNKTAYIVITSKPHG